MFNKKYIIYLLLAGLCIIAYANSLKGGFVSDDVERILENPYISRLPDSWFRPQELLNSLSYRISKLNPVPYHLFSILLHFANTLLVFLLLRLFFARGPSFLGAAIFAVHPAHAEAVAWISGRAYLISTFFILTTYLLYYRKTRVSYLLSLAIFCYFINRNFSFYAFFPFLIIFSDIIFERWRKDWKLWLPFVLITALRLVTSSYQIEERISEATLQTGRIDAWANLFFYFAYSIFSHLWVLIWPARLTLYHEPVIFYPWAMWLGFAALCALAACLPFLFKRAKSILLGIGVFVLFLAPTYSPFPVANVVAERYLYLPSIFMCILVSFFWQAYIEKAPSVKRRYFAAFFILLIGAYAARTVIRNEDWKDAKTLWLATLKASPDSSGAHNNAGFIYLKEGDVDKAIGEFNLAIRISPDRPDSYNNLGVARKTKGEFEEAAVLYKRAIALKPDYAQAYNNLGNIYQNNGKPEEAMALYKKALAFKPDYVEALNNLGVAYKNLSMPQEAIKLYGKAVAINPSYAASYKNLSVAYYLKGEYAQAIKYYDLAVKRGCRPDPVFLKILKPYRQTRLH